MTTRIILAAILGGIAMFIWSFVAHDILPLGDAGIREIPGEKAVTTAMQESINNQAGLYFFPGFGLGDHASREDKKKAMEQANEKMATNPSGLLLYHPPGRVFSFSKLLGVEFVTELIEAFLLVFLLAQTRITSFGGRVGFVFTAGLVAAIATNVPYWNWWGFPGIYTVSYMTIQIVAFLIVGIVAALVLKKGMPA